MDDEWFLKSSFTSSFHKKLSTFLGTILARKNPNYVANKISGRQKLIQSNS